MASRMFISHDSAKCSIVRNTCRALSASILKMAYLLLRGLLPIMLDAYMVHIFFHSEA